ncbi:MAG: YbaB/EbfC family nucleoid-associated protein [candidate division KSB1 bacterium]|nr:YbaB/EbfC family nucleoid-associated protein [candidate division KSB1 bacterium]MDZ7275734.1 YbaB/EbfC family nucleoid-associated protein [candidate division KSB1 bacterium]MDZ7284575.1 YbaB/EbfC family nucleoid-associated protein [candidate division KSB1 bacterium]MDZ7298006.1 YbaB/EbfC family nucleoid-associated protein [candidate division KSB1 bacterium]MDZ7305826.1 YbaB/EbfC family nucleoid-associated protein [candidate division KSB1 bacterium]
MSRPSLGEILKRAQALHEKISETQESLANQRVEGTAGGGMVTVVMNGRREVLQVKIEKEIINPDDKELLEDLVVAAVNQALVKAQELEMTEMSKVTGGVLSQLTGGLQMPGL